MDTYENLSEILQQTQTNDKRVFAENLITQYKKENSTKLICSLIREQCNASNPDVVLQMASLIFKNILVNSSRDEDGDDLWFKLQPDLQKNIKDGLLSVLANDNKAAMKSAGTSLAIIAALEVPEGKWDEFLNMMSENAVQENYQFRLASIYCLGLMSEFLEQHVQKPLSDEQIGKILHATICNINGEQAETTKIAVKALSRTITQTAKNFQLEAQRDFIMKGIFAAIEINDEQVQEDAIQTLMEVPNIAYLHIGDYITKIGEYTTQLMATDRYQLIGSMIEFWINLAIAEEQHVRNNSSLGIFSSYRDGMFQLIYQGLTLYQCDKDDIDLEDNEEDSQWTVQKSCALLLAKVSVLLKDVAWEKTKEFAQSRFNHENWMEQQASIVAITAALEGQDSQTLHADLVPIASSLIQRLSESPVAKIRFSICWFFEQVLKSIPAVMFSNVDDLSKFINQGKQHITSDHPQISKFVIKIWGLLFSSADQMDNHTKQLLNNYFNPMVQALLEQLFSQKGIQFDTLVLLTSALSECCQHCDAENLNDQMFALLELLYTQISNYLQSPQTVFPNVNDEQHEILLSHICGILQPVIVHVGSDKITDEVLQAFIQMAVQIFNSVHKVSSGGLFIITSLMHAVETRMLPLVANFVQYLFHAFEMEQSDSQTLNLTCGAISDMCTYMPDAANQYCAQFIEKLQKVLNEESFETETKLRAITATGDLCMATGEQFFAYPDTTFSSLAQASASSLQKSEDPEDNQIYEQLRYALIESYLTLYHGMVDEENLKKIRASGQLQMLSPKLEQHTHQIYYYLEAAITGDYSFDEEHLYQIIEIYLDIMFMVTRSIQGQSTQVSPLGMEVMNSTLFERMRDAVGGLPCNNEMANEIKARFVEIQKMVENFRKSGSIAPGAPMTFGNTNGLQLHNPTPIYQNTMINSES